MLVALYNATDGPNWRRKNNWLSSLPLSDWEGVATNSVGRVTKLELYRNDLDGNIPSSVGQLSSLERLDLQQNYLSGGIPSAIGDLSQLQLLSLGDNDLTGSIPTSLGNLSALKTLNLANNELVGGLPSSLGNLSNLESLLLEYNSGLGGPLPHSLTNTSLQELNADGTDLCAPQDAQFQSWLDSLRRRSVKRCPLSNDDRETLVAFYNATAGPNWRSNTDFLSNRPINEWLGVSVDSEGRVSRLSLNHFGLRGDIPSSLADLSNLRGLHLAYSYLTGSIPGTLGDLTNLEWLWLENNQLSGGIPASLGKLTALKGLYLQNNEAMSGSLPGALTGMTSLNTLRLDGTGLCVPRTDTFQTWLDGIETKQFEYCDAESEN